VGVRQGDIYLMAVPYSDLSGRKTRPVLVVSKDDFNNGLEDVIICGITSNSNQERDCISITNKDTKEGCLDYKSMIKVENIFKVDKVLLLRKIGCIKKEKVLKVIKKLNFLFS